MKPTNNSRAPQILASHGSQLKFMAAATLSHGSLGHSTGLQMSPKVVRSLPALKCSPKTLQYCRDESQPIFLNGS